MYVLASFAADWKILALFVACFCVIASMYGGGFATIPAYLADMFGTQFVGAIHGRLLTAWSTAGIVGPVIVNYMHDTRQAEGIAPDQIYGPIFYILAGLLVVGFVANLLVRPVNPKWHMSEADVAAEHAKHVPASSNGCDDVRRSASAWAALDFKATLFWLFVGIPLAWGDLEHGREGAGAVPLAPAPASGKRLTTLRFPSRARRARSRREGH